MLLILNVLVSGLVPEQADETQASDWHQGRTRNQGKIHSLHTNPTKHLSNSVPAPFWHL